MSPAPGWQPLLDAIAACTDDATRHALQLVADHVVAEVAGDVPGVLATLVPEPVYRIWGASSSTGPQGAAQVRQFYDDLVGSGKNRLDYALDRVVADAGAVVTEGQFHHVYAGEVLAGKALPGLPVQAGRWYHVAYQALVVWPVRDGLLAGEDIYAGEAPQVLAEVAAGDLAHLGPAGRV